MRKLFLAVCFFLSFSACAEDIYLSMDFKDADLLNVLKIIAQEKKLNIIAGNDISGKVTANFTNVRFEEALDSILTVNGYTYENKGGIIRIMPLVKYQMMKEKNSEALMKTEIIKLAHSSASDITPMLEALKSEKGKITSSDTTNTIVIVDFPDSIEKMKSVISSVDVKLTPKEIVANQAKQLNIENRVFIMNNAIAHNVLEAIEPMLTKEVGRAVSDLRTNSLIVIDNPVVIDQIADYIKVLDKKVKQVMIEAKIIEIAHNKNNVFGIDAIFAPDSSTYTAATTTAAASETISTVMPGDGLKSTRTERFPRNREMTRIDTVDIQGLGVTLGGILKMGQLNAIDFGIVMRTINQKTNSKLLSSPKIATVENEEAKISVTTKVPYSNTQKSGDTGAILGTNIEYKDIPLELIVTPRINNDGEINMKIATRYETIVGYKNNEPIIDSRSADSKLVVKNGNTIVIGGLIRNEDITTEKRVPILSSIPILGSAFKSKERTGTQSELIIFITPRLITDEVDALSNKEARELIKDKLGFDAAKNTEIGREEPKSIINRSEKIKKLIEELKEKHK